MKSVSIALPASLLASSLAIGAEINLPSWLQKPDSRIIRQVDLPNYKALDSDSAMSALGMYSVELNPENVGFPDAGNPQFIDETFAMSGNAFIFGPGGGLIEGATVQSLEWPSLETTTDSDGYYSFDGIATGSEVSFLLTAEGYWPTQTGTFVVGESDIEQVSIQVPSRAMVHMIEVILKTKSDRHMCHISSTVTELGGSLYGTTPSHGEPGATVTIDPPVDAEHGPVYFTLVSDNIVVPDPSATETSEDGGVLFVNVQPGEYILTAHKDGMEFTQARVTCRAGLLVNASPPYALQAIPTED